MKRTGRIAFTIFAALALALSAWAADPLPSWNDGKAKQSLVDMKADGKYAFPSEVK